MRSNLIIAPIAALIVAAASGPSIRAADVGDLRVNYSGAAHHISVDASENEPIELQITGTQPNGKFTGAFGETTVAGKVTSSGKITFSGGDFKNCKGQLSATGRFIVGTFTYKGDGPAQGKYTFSVDAETTSIK